MRGPNTTVLRRLVPAFAVTAVLALAALLPSPPIGLANAAYGYANNCGVKGYGTHDHGKPCPNRPFPGKGKGLTKAIQSGETGTSESSGTTSSNNEDETSDDSSVVSVSENSSSGSSTVQVQLSSHGKNQAHIQGRSRGRGHGHTDAES
jgi:hypothetical protein